MIPSLAKAAAATGSLVVLLAGPVAAQEPSAEDRAYDLFQQSVEKYREGQFEEAAALLEEANRLDPDPILVYNLARAYEGMGDFERAVTAYQQYLRDAPDARDRGAVEARVETLEREIRDRERRGDREGEPGQQVPGSSGSVAPFFLVGLGVAGLGVGTVFGILSNDAHTEAENAPDFTTAFLAQEDAEAWAIAANVALVAGGVALAAGGAWLIIEAVTGDEEPGGASVSAWLGPNSGAVSFSQAW